MLQKKRAEIIDQFRRIQRDNFKVQIRKTILDQRPYPLSSSNGAPCQQGEQGSLQNAEQLSESELCGPLEQPREEELKNIIVFFDSLLLNQNVDLRLFGKIPQFLRNLLIKFRKLIMFGGQLTGLNKIRDIYTFIRLKIELTIADLDIETEDLVIQNEIFELSQCRNMLHETLLMMTSEYLNQNQKICQTETSQIWLIYELFIWMNKLKSKLKEIVKMQSIEELRPNTLVLERKICLYKYYLKQQRIFFNTLLHEKNAQFEDVLNFMFDEKYLKDVVSILNSHLTPDNILVLISDILIQCCYFQKQFFFSRLIEAEIMSFIKVQLIFREEYKNFTKKIKLTEGQMQYLKIIWNILEFLLYLSQSIGSDILWENAIYQDLKEISHEIKDRELRDLCIEGILSSCSEITQEKTMKYIDDAEILDWIVKILESANEILPSMEQNMEEKERKIEFCLVAIRFFINYGQTIKCSNINPYILKLRSIQLPRILNQSYQGQMFLQQFFEGDEL